MACFVISLSPSGLSYQAKTSGQVQDVIPSHVVEIVFSCDIYTFYHQFHATFHYLGSDTFRACQELTFKSLGQVKDVISSF